MHNLRQRRDFFRLATAFCLLSSLPLLIAQHKPTSLTQVCYNASSVNSKLSEDDKYRALAVVRILKEELLRSPVTNMTFEDYQNRLREKMDADDGIKDKDGAADFAQNMHMCIVVHKHAENCSTHVMNTHRGVLDEEDWDKLLRADAEALRESKDRFKDVIRGSVGKKLEASFKALGTLNKCLYGELEHFQP